jgi:dTDP-glucose 4,6-dehydratase
MRSYMHPTDLVIWLLAILVRGQSARAYNVGSSQAVSIAELAHEIARLSGSGIAVNIAGSPGASNPVNHYVPDITRARVELGLPPPMPLDQAIQRTLTTLRQVPSSC